MSSAFNLRYLAELRQSQLKDQFSETTRVVRRNLLVAAAVAIVLSLPGVEAENFLGIKISDHNIAVGAVAIAVGYEFVSFFVYGVIDWLRWRIDPGAILINEIGPAQEALKNHIAETAHEMAGIRATLQQANALSIDLQGYAQRIAHLSDSMSKAVDAYLDDERVHRRQLGTHNVVQLFRMIGIDWLIPIGVGGYALYATRGALCTLVIALF